MNLQMKETNKKWNGKSFITFLTFQSKKKTMFILYTTITCSIMCVFVLFSASLQLLIVLLGGIYLFLVQILMVSHFYFASSIRIEY